MDYALITGASAGLGLCIARQFATSRIVPILTGRNVAAMEQAKQAIQDDFGLSAYCFAADLMTENAPADLYCFARDQNLIPRYLIHNLGGGIQGDCKNPPSNVLRDSFRLNLGVAVELNALFYNDLKERSAKIVHIGSTSSLHYDAPPSYVISKTAMIAYVKNAARSFAKDGLTIFGILPGVLQHPGSYVDRLKTQDPRRYEKFLSTMTYGCFVDSREVANYLVSLCLVDSTMINGSIITIDGGVD